MYLGLDMGTSGLRGLLVDATGATVAEAVAEYEAKHPHPGWSEQDPQLWIDAMQAVMTQLCQSAPNAVAAIRGMAIAGHMHGAVLLDTADTPLRPCILWNDTRAHAEAAALDTTKIRGVTGNIVFPGFTAPKLLWVETHEPDVFAATDCVLLPKDYLRLWLTGSRMMEMSDAAGTAWLDTGARAWSRIVLDASHMRESQMPPLVEGSAAAGELRPELAAQWGIQGRVTLAGGAADNAAAACGAGCMAEGQGFVSLGTSGVLLAARDGYAPDAATAVHTFCHALPDRWYQMGVILAATDSLNWLARITGKTPAQLAAGLPDTPDAPGALRFLPYLSGERTPHNDAAIRGAFVGLDVAQDASDMARAVMEGVAFALRDCRDALAATGVRFETLLGTGGGMQSPFWVQTVANTLEMPITLPEGNAFGAALGAARLAILADTGTLAEQIMTLPKTAQVIAPASANTDAYTEAHARHRALYPATKA